MAIEKQPNQFTSRSQGDVPGVKSTNTSASLSGATNSIRSNTITENLNGKKVHFAVDITTAFASVSSVAVSIEGSLDDVNYTVLATPETNILPQNTGPRFYTVDLTKFNGIPYFTIHFNGCTGISSGSIGTSGKLSFSYYTTTPTSTSTTFTY